MTSATRHVGRAAVRLVCLLLLPATSAFAPAADSGSPWPMSVPLTPDNTVTGAIALPGQQDRFTWIGSPGQRLVFDALQPTSSFLRVRLAAPSGAETFRDWNAESDVGPLYLTETGEYTLTVYAWDDGIGGYSFRLLNAADASALNLGVAVSGVLDPPAEANLYSFSAVAGQQLLLESLSATHGNAYWSLVSPDNATLTGAPITANAGPVVLSQTGSYLLLVQGTADAASPLSYQVRVSVVGDPVGVPDGFQRCTGTLNAGDTEEYTLTAPAGTLAYFDSLDPTYTPLLVDLRAPGGALVGSFPLYSDAGPLLLSSSGNYSLQVRSTDPGSGGSYDFQMIDLGSQATLLSLGTARSDSLPPYAVRAYRFSGQVGRRLVLDLLGDTGGWVGAGLLAPSGSQLLAWTWGGTLDPAPVTVTEPGNHLLFFSSGSDLSQTFGFRLIDVAQPPSAALVFGAPVSGNLAGAYQTDVYRFSAIQGEHLLVDGQGSGADVNWALYGPLNDILAAGPGSSDWELLAPRTGTYVFTLANQTDAPAAYQTQVIAAHITSQPLPLGAVIDANLAEVGQQLWYTFTAEPGTWFFYDALDLAPGSGALAVHLFGPDQAPAGPSFWSAIYDQTPFALSQPGTYTLALGGEGGAVGNIRFRLIRLDQAPAVALPLNTLVQGVIDPPTESDCFTFPGTREQRLFFDSQNVVAQGSWTLYGPDGGYTAGGSLSSDLALNLPSSGSYQLVLSGSGSAAVNYSFRLLTPSQPVTALTLGAVVNGSIAEVGQQPVYTFAGAVGQRLYFDGLSTGPVDQPVTLSGPSGSWVFSASTRGDAGPVTLSEVGAYRLTVGGASDALGPYRFRLSDLANVPAMGADVAAALDASNESDLYWFDGVGGQRVVLDSVASSSSEAAWALVGARDQVLASGPITSDLTPVVLPQEASYIVVVAGYGDGSSATSYQLHRTVTEPVGVPSGFGAVEQGTLGPGEEHPFTFTAPAGELVYFDSQAPSASSLIAWLTGPDSETVFQVSAAYDAGPYLLANSGTYTLVVLGADPTAQGDYRFRFLDLQANSTPLNPGTVVSLTLDDPYQAEFLRFTAARGQRFLYDALTAPWLNSAAIAVWNPDGTYFQGGQYATAHSDVGPFNITSAGDYFLQLSNAEVDPVVVQFRLLESSQPPAADLGWNEVKSGTLDPGHQAQLYRVTVSGQRRLFGHGSGADLNASWTLYDPNNQWLASQSATADFESALTQDGSYLVVVSGAVADPVEFTVQVSEPGTSSQTLTLETVIDDTLADAGEEHRYTFTGSAGQVLYYDALLADYPNIQMTLTAPSGRMVLGGNPYYDQGTFRLTESGQYDLVQRNLGFDPMNYRFRLLDLSGSPVLTADSLFTGNVDPGYGAQLFRLEAHSGWRYFFDAQGPAGDAYWQLLAPEGLYLGSSWVNGDFEATARQEGTLVLVISSASADPLPYTFQIVPGNHRPVLSPIGNRSLNELTMLAFTALASDVEAPNDQLTFSLDPGAPAGVAIDPVTGAVSWTPTEAQGPGDYPLTVRVTDDGLPPLDAAETIVVSVREINLPPTLIVPVDQVMNEQTTLSVTNRATDPDLPANALTFGVVSGPDGLMVDPSTGQLTWTPTEAQGPSTNLVIVKVSDSNPDAVNEQQLSVTNAFTVTVREINLPPTLIVPVDQVMNEQTTLSVTNRATDPDLPANALTFGLVSGPDGVLLDPSTGLLTWTPGEEQGWGSYTVTVRVTDSNPDAVNEQQLIVTNSFNVTVREVNLPPVLTVPGDQVLDELTTLTVTNLATDPDLPANPLTFGWVSRPEGMFLDSATGRLTWMPTEAQGPSTNLVVLKVTDRNPDALTQLLSATNSFTVIVREVNRPPALTLPSDSTLHAGQVLEAAALVYDPDWPVNGLTFALESAPVDAAIDAQTGVVQWPTNPADAYTTNLISVRVTDSGTPPFSATRSFAVTVVGELQAVAPVIAGSTLTLSWAAAPGQTYRVQYKDDLGQAEWIDLAEDVFATGNVASAQDLGFDSARSRFYRITVVP